MRGAFLPVILGVLLLLGACTNRDSPAPELAETSQPAAYRTITAREAKSMLEGDRVILLDVRTQAEFDERHIAGAVLIPDTELAARAVEELPDKDAVILLYCRSGRRSALAALELAAQGYEYIYDFGGIMDWPYDTVP